MAQMLIGTWLYLVVMPEGAVRTQKDPLALSPRTLAPAPLRVGALGRDLIPLPALCQGPHVSLFVAV
jgi:hypothetical protein